MPKELNKLVAAAKKVRMTPSEKEEQRRSFAYGNARIENELVTRETVDRQAETLKPKSSN